MRNHLFSTSKIDYIRGNKPDVDCILCGIRDRSEAVKNLEIFRSGNFIISLNLYPYNPGHLMIFPRKHVEELEDLSEDELSEMNRLVIRSIKILREELAPGGFNIGFNLGEVSGASIRHLHQHIVPRYGNEAGFLDILSGTRVVVIDPNELQKRLIAKFSP